MESKRFSLKVELDFIVGPDGNPTPAEYNASVSPLAAIEGISKESLMLAYIWLADEIDGIMATLELETGFSREEIAERARPRFQAVIEKANLAFTPVVIMGSDRPTRANQGLNNPALAQFFKDLAEADKTEE